MTLSVADRVLETSTTTGLGTINLAGAVTGFRSFIAAVGSGEKVPYAMDDGVNWETGIGTVTAGTPDTLSRTTVTGSSNGGALVNWGAGTRNVRLAPTAKTNKSTDENLNLVNGYGGAGGGSANAQTITLYPVPLGYSDGMILSWYSQGAVNSALTLNVNGLGAKTVKWRGADLTNGAFAAGNLIVGQYKASSGFVELISPPNNVSVADGSITFAKIASAAIATVADMLAGTLSKLVSASNLKTFLETYITSPWVAYTPTFTGFGTPSSVEFFSRRVGDTLQVKGKFTSGVSTATEARVTLGHNGTDSNVTTTASKIPSGVSLAGNWAVSSAATVTCNILAERSVGYMTFGTQDASNSGLTKRNANTFISNGQSISLFAEFPINGW